MEVFCVGLRGGSSSLARALEILGYPRVYSMGQAVQRYAHMRAWQRHATGHRPLDMEAIFRGWDASKAHPAMMYPEDVLATFPQAKVVLLRRDDEAWFDSYCRLYQSIEGLGGRFGFLPRLRAIRATVRATTFEPLGPGVPEAKDRVLTARRALHERVRRLVPPERLLEWDVRDGWEPLCAFLDRPVPDRPFPWENVGQAAVRRAVRRALLRELAWLGAGLAILGSALLIGLSLAGAR
jgi:hypothetical protein